MKRVVTRKPNAEYTRASLLDVTTNTSPTTLSRAMLLSRGARISAGVLAAGAAGGVFAATAAADPLSPSDIALVRLLVGVELLTADFYGQAIAASNTSSKV